MTKPTPITEMQKLLDAVEESVVAYGLDESMFSWEILKGYIRTLENEHRAMRNELELISEGKGCWATDVLRSLTLNP